MPAPPALQRTCQKREESGKDGTPSNISDVEPLDSGP